MDTETLLSAPSANVTVLRTMQLKQFRETFDHGPCGWIGWDGVHGPIPVEIRDGVAVSRSPWWIDCNHAPPGAGYLHILFALHTRHGPGFSEAIRRAGGPNRYVAGGYPTDLRNARVTVRLKGKVDLRGAKLCFLVQGNLSDDPAQPHWVNQVLTAQPFTITPDWSEQTIQLVPDPRQWTDLGARHDRAAFYKTGPIEQLLRNVNGDFILVLFPLDVRPLVPVDGNPHQYWWDGRDGHVADPAYLPQGEVMMDEFRIDFP